MQTQLPRRPYVELPPPPDGLTAARRDAARRRARRAIAVIGGGVSAVVVTVVLVLLGGGGDVAVLRPAPVPPATQLPRPAGETPHAATPTAALPGASPAAPASSIVTTASGPHAAGNARGNSGQTAPRRPATGEPTLVRSSSAFTGATRVCAGSTSNDSSGQHNGVGWCVDAATTAAEGGEKLVLTLCRDSTGPGDLTFTSSREVDLAVVRGGATVWSWSHDHPGSPSQHSLTATANGCWNWSLVWPGVTQSGAAAPHGSYTLVATSTADELRGKPAAQVSFDY